MKFLVILTVLLVLISARKHRRRRHRIQRTRQDQVVVNSLKCTNMFTRVGGKEEPFVPTADCSLTISQAGVQLDELDPKV